MFWALILLHGMIPYRNVIVFAYKHRPALDQKREVREGHKKTKEIVITYVRSHQKHNIARHREMFIPLVES